MINPLSHPIHFLRRLRSLPLQEQRALAIAALCLATAGAARACLSTSRLRDFGAKPRPTLEPLAVSAAALALQQERRQSIDLGRRAIDRISLAAGIQNCLVRALALRLLLSRRGIATTLHIGVRKNAEGALLAHAWLSSNGFIVIGENTAQARSGPGAAHSAGRETLGQGTIEAESFVELRAWALSPGTPHAAGIASKGKPSAG